MRTSNHDSMLLREELHRHAVDQRARQNADQREQHDQPQRELGAEHARA